MICRHVVGQTLRASLFFFLIQTVVLAIYQMHVLTQGASVCVRMCVSERESKRDAFSETISHFYLIWRADGRPASVQEAFWDDSHEIPPQVPLDCDG